MYPCRDQLYTLGSNVRYRFKRPASLARHGRRGYLRCERAAFRSAERHHGALKKADTKFCLVRHAPA